MKKIIPHVDKTWDVELVILNPIKHTTARWVEKLHFSSALNFYIQIFFLPGEKKKQENDLTKISQNTFSHIPWDQRTPYLIKLPQNPSSVSTQVNIKTLLIYQD